MAGGEARPGPGNRRIRGKIVKEQISWAGLVPLASTGLILTAMTVSAGRGIRGEQIVTPKIMTAGVMLLIPITLMNQTAPGFAGAFSMLIFVASFLVYGPDILRYVGFTVQPEV